MDLVRQTLEMVGKAKPKEEQSAETEANVANIQADQQAQQQEAPPEAQPGPITGQPGFNPNDIGGPLKLGSALKAALKK